MIPIKASIVVLTYNHIKFIQTCLDSILAQKTTFAFELLIGEDMSSDGTREICESYAQKYPEKITLFLRNREDVIYINGQATGRFNFISTIRAATGKYIALCEGDDYWTDPLKLQKQVEFLEANPKYVLSFHKVQFLFPDGSSKEDDFSLPSQYEETEGLASYGNYIYTVSAVFRNVIDTFPDDFLRSPLGDFYLFFMLSLKGKLKRFPEEMAVYRYGVGIWSGKSDYYRCINTAIVFGYLYRYCIDYKIRGSLAIIFLGRIKSIMEQFNEELKIRDLLILGVILTHPKTNKKHGRKVINLYKKVLKKPDIVNGSEKYIIDLLNINKNFDHLLIEDISILKIKTKELKEHIYTIHNNALELINTDFFNFSLVHHWEVLEVSDKKIKVIGWGYLKNTDDTFLENKYLLFYSHSCSFIYPLVSVLREDVTTYFNSVNKYNNSGFDAEIVASSLKLPVGVYSIGLYIENKNGQIGFTISESNFVSDIPKNPEPIDLTSITCQIVHNWDVLEISESKIQLAGWGFLKNTSNSFLETKYLLFFSNDGSYIFPLDSILRKDVSIYFNSGNNYDYSGFETEILIPNLKLPKGEYKIGLYIEDVRGQEGFILSEIVINFLELGT